MCLALFARSKLQLAKLSLQVMTHPSHIYIYIYIYVWGIGGRDGMLVAFRTTCVISVYHN
jgi:hypothetical protein